MYSFSCPSMKTGETRTINWMIPTPMKRIKIDENDSALSGVNPAKLELMSLEILQKIFGYLDPNSAEQLRKVSKRVCAIYDHMVIKDFRRQYIKEYRQDCNSLSSVACQCILIACDYFWRHDYLYTFVNSLFPLNINDQLRLKMIANYESVIRNFYVHLQYLVQMEYNRDIGLLFTMTIIRLLRNFKMISKDIIEINPKCRQLTITVKGIWFGLLWRGRNTNTDHYQKHLDCLMILFKLLACDMCNNVLSTTVHTNNDIYVFGRETFNTRRYLRMKTKFQFKIFSSGSSFAYFCNCFKKSEPICHAPIILPEDNIVINLSIDSRESMKHGCGNDLHFDFTFPVQPDDEHETFSD